MVEIYGILGECRLKHPDRGWPNTWASYWCGEWFERKRAPVFDPTPKYFIDDYEQRKKHAQSKDVES